MQLNGQQPWRLRWCFDYVNKPTVRGVWNAQIDGEPSASAFMQSKNGLLYAAIEAQDRDKTKVLRVSECNHEDFCNFEWIATAKVPGFAKVDVVPTPVIIGIKLITRYSEIAVYVDGAVETKAREYEDNLFHFGRSE